jgi:hypothetical protein
VHGCFISGQPTTINSNGLHVAPVLRFTLAQPLDRRFQSSIASFLPLGVGDPLHIFLFVTVTEVLEGFSRFGILRQRNLKIRRDR